MCPYNSTPFYNLTWSLLRLMNPIQYPDLNGLDNIGSSLNEIQFFCLTPRTIFSVMNLPDTNELAISSYCQHVIGTLILESWSISEIMFDWLNFEHCWYWILFFPWHSFVLPRICLSGRCSFIYFNSRRNIFSPPNYSGKCESTCFLVLLEQ